MKKEDRKQKTGEEEVLIVLPVVQIAGVLGRVGGRNTHGDILKGGSGKELGC